MDHATLLTTEGLDERAAHPLTRYQDDAHAWAMEQAKLIRLGRFRDLDIENLADEVEDVARRERRALVSRLALVYQHLLTWDYQRERRSASWARTVREQRTQVEEILDENRSLRSRLDALVELAYRQGRVAALNDTGLDESVIPDANAFSWDETVNRPIVWPEP